jgi:hypothetical protein
MIKERVHPNGEAATDLAAAIIANAAAFHKEVSRLYGDLGRLHTKLPSNRIDAIFPAVMIRTLEAHGPSRSRPHRFE